MRHANSSYIGLASRTKPARRGPHARFELWCEHVVGLVRERGIDAVLISRISDRGVPSTQVVELFNRTLTELSESTTVVLPRGITIPRCDWVLVPGS